MLITFTDAEETKRWLTVNDDGMGGISQMLILINLNTDSGRT